MWGPQPLAWLWIGSQADYRRGSHMLGIVVAFVGILASLFITLSLASRLDRVWRMVRRAAGHEQRDGVLPRIFGAIGGDRAGRVRRLVPGDRGPGAVARAALMRRFLSYYRQFDELSPEEVSRELRERRDEERRRHPAEPPPLDLSGAAWHGPPHPEVVNAATFALRRAVNAYPDASPLRAAIAASHDVDPARVVDRARRGRAAARRAARGRATARSQVVWPGWGPLPRLVREAGATPVPVALERARRRRRTTVADAGPNDPTGASCRCRLAPRSASTG